MAALQFETLIDGQIWSASSGNASSRPEGASWVGRGRDLVFLVCASEDQTVLSDGLPAGAHTAKLRATLPGTDIVLESESVDFTLDCAHTDGGGGGCAAGGSDTSALGALAVALAALMLGWRLSPRARRRG
jgi:hypothetical protein